MSSLRIEGPCVKWPGVRNEDCYGHVTFNGRRFSAHRFVYELAYGPIPEGLQIDHLCRVHCCVSPAHLEAVTHKENILRGISMVAENVHKTHCPRGHAYEGGNLYVRPGGHRLCRKCRSEWIAKHRAVYGRPSQSKKRKAA